jgi:hypothetical protein
MPGLYSKLVEAKRTTLPDATLQSEKDVFAAQPLMKKFPSSGEDSKMLAKRESLKKSEEEEELRMSE